QLDELRRRVYARDATPEAAGEYAAALALRGATARAVPAAPPASGGDAAAPASPEPAQSTRRSRWTTGAAIAGVVAVAAVAASFSLHPSPTARPSAAGVGSAGVAATALPVPPPVPGPVLATLSSVGASASATLDAKGHTVVLASLCNGDGTVTIRVSGDSTTVLACARGMPALVMVETTKALGRFTVTTTSEGRPHWTLTIGTLYDRVTRRGAG
ncbi:MAG: hypothetical protein QOC59_583, partial [Microbacteriaceae bacterium]|nr:hypothetical protein [Microbacteriaceae bacterium]